MADWVEDSGIVLQIESLLQRGLTFGVAQVATRPDPETQGGRTEPVAVASVFAVPGSRSAHTHGCADEVPQAQFAGHRWYGQVVEGLRQARPVAVPVRLPGPHVDRASLGPLQVQRDGVDVVLTAPKVKAVLLVLLVRLDEVVTADQLIDALWPALAPDSAKKLVQVHVCVAAAGRKVLRSVADSGNRLGDRLIKECRATGGSRSR